MSSSASDCWNAAATQPQNEIRHGKDIEQVIKTKNKLLDVLRLIWIQIGVTFSLETWTYLLFFFLRFSVKEFPPAVHFATLVEISNLQDQTF